MSETLFKILLSELHTVRLVCKNMIPAAAGSQQCGSIIEIAVDKLSLVRACPICGNQIHLLMDPKEDPFRLLSDAFARFKGQSQVELSFVMPHSDK